MKAFADKLVWMAILSLVLVVLVGAAGYILSPAGQVKAAQDIPNALTNGQRAAIQGAQTLLLLTPSANWSFLPLVER